MESQILTLFLGFILTSVGGGLLAYYFQNRTWKHQNAAKLQENERATAKEVFETISALMDKRIYRMRLLSWSLEDETKDDEIIEKHLAEYRQVLCEWNDALIRNLALTQAYFGKDIRRRLGGSVYEEFKRIGSVLEKQYRERKERKRVSESSSIDAELSSLSNQMYSLNFEMIGLIQKGKVGIFNPDTSREKD